MKKRIIISLLIATIYILGKNIPVAFVIADSHQLNLLNMKSIVESMIGDDGGNASIFLLGLSPWMSAMILARIIGFFMDEKSNKVAPHRMRIITNTLMIGFTLIQAISKVRTMKFDSPALNSYGRLGLSLFVICEIFAGSLFLVWLVEKNMKLGIGGPSLIILINIIINISMVIGKYSSHTFNHVGIMAYVIVFFYILMTVAVTIILTQSEVRIPVYKSSIHNEYASSNYLLFKLNPLGTLPSMYIVSIYALLISLFHTFHELYKENKILSMLVKYCDIEHLSGVLFFISLFFLFSIILSFIIVDPKDIADNLLKNGDCIENVRPGKQTKNYLNMVLLVLTVISNIIIMIIMVTPLLVGFSFKGKTDLFSMPLTFMILTSIVLNVKEEFDTRLLGNIYEKRLIHLERGEK